MSFFGENVELRKKKDAIVGAWINKVVLSLPLLIINMACHCSGVFPVFQSQGTPVPAAPPQPKTKPPREEDFENIKLISNGAYGLDAYIVIYLYSNINTSLLHGKNNKRSC